MRGAGFLAIWSDIAPNNLTDYRHWLTREHTTERVTTKGFLASRVFRAVRTSVPTVEKGMRQDEGFFAGLLIIEALDEASLRSALRQAAEMAPDLFGGIGEPEIYQGMFALDARIASVE